MKPKTRAVKFILQNTCLWCDAEIPMNKMLCSFKCLNEAKKEARKQGVESSFEKEDVYRGDTGV